MSTELELKLMIQPAHIESARQVLHDICTNASHCSVGPTLELMNGYFDTEDELLMRSGVALRIRSVNQTYIQTVKTRGTNRVGMHARGEWEWEIPNNKLDLSLVDNSILPAALHNRKWDAQLIEVFRTDFTRNIFIICHEGAEIEVALDRGKVHSSYGTDDIHEIELELKQGEEKCLYEFACRLAQLLPIQINTISKAAKGVRLKKKKMELPEVSTTFTNRVAAALHWYEMWLSYWEAMCFFDDAALLTPMSDVMEQLSACLPKRLATPVAELNIELQETYHLSGEESPYCLTELLSVGHVMLKVGYWLNSKH